MPKVLADLITGEMSDKLQKGAADSVQATAADPQQLMQTAGCPPPTNGCHTQGCR
jgi:hypothetical protein